MSKKKINKKITRFFQSDTPIVSDRARVILSSPEDSANLVKAIRNQRDSSTKTATFKLTESVSRRLKALES